ncbi:MAG: hypothetical protein NTU83_08065, partial [Candidatus Hydrogenedentes bacterium]|nr:hypothetical protein [Candidatus Hydrogenedentota bacterium]
ADAAQPQVNKLYHRVLEASFRNADLLAGHPTLPLRNLVKYVPWLKAGSKETEELENGPCFIYPEVSASVQGFVRSRVSKGGIYLFSDTGAATVDQSVFIFRHGNGKTDRLTYLFANVLPLGSSQIEQRAALEAGESNWRSLEKWRRLKETGDTATQLTIARNQVGHGLQKETIATLFTSKKKLNADNIEKQLQELRVIFGGGGHVENPYEKSVIGAFGDERVFGIRPHILMSLGCHYPMILALRKRFHVGCHAYG